MDGRTACDYTLYEFTPPDGFGVRPEYRQI
jgi:hypothetical protein